MRYRYESFGGIIAADDPPLLAFVDRTYMREQGLGSSDRWQDGDEDIGQLSAPVEVHFACTNRCSQGCPHCYMDSGVATSRELDTQQFKASLDALAAMGVFHVALGGGEALERDDLFELAEHARHLGIVPNLTSNGQRIDQPTAQRMKMFGQVNLSLDGVGATAGVFRSGAKFEEVDAAFSRLLEAGVSTGINCVLGRQNFEGLPALFEYAAVKGLAEIELLRFKPSGRAGDLYAQCKTTPEQNRALFPWLEELGRQFEVKTKIDCSFVPMLCCHHPPREALEAFCVCGCEAGNFLIGAHSDGRVCGCSFLPATDLTVAALPESWDRDPELQRYRQWPDMAPEPCAGCEYLDICKGGCHAVALAVTGSIDAPDPECPVVEEWKQQSHADR